MTTEVTADRLVKAYIKMRDARSALKSKYEEEDGKIKDDMEKVESLLLDMCKTNGMDGIKTQYGTASRTVQTRYWTGDWSAMHDFIYTNNAIDLLERRIAQGAMRDFLKENPDKLPPGLNVDSRYTINVRRSTT